MTRRREEREGKVVKKFIETTRETSNAHL